MLSRCFCAKERRPLQAINALTEILPIWYNKKAGLNKDGAASRRMNRGNDAVIDRQE